MRLNVEKFERFITVVGLAVLLIIAVKNPTKGTVRQWHDAIDERMSWNEYTKEAM